ncbi:MAG: hypothetical protein CVT64_11550 [Actinobacteria bacterium HGW-Actinobacteria-4]|nr:MAG: hypothetical protein CVT64_11550 [Actinobacteria bacterium HGW-Actinobacteria-4]
MDDFKTMLTGVAQRESAATRPVDARGYVRTVGRRRAVRHAGQGAVAIVAGGGLAYGGLVLADQVRDVQPGGTPSPTATHAPVESPTPTPEPSFGPASIVTPWGTAWPESPPQPLDPATTAEDGWQVWSKYAASIATPMCGEPYDRSIMDTDSYYDLEAAVRNPAPAAGGAFDFAARITNLSDVDLSATRWQGPLIMFLDADGVVVAFMHLDPTTVEGPEYFDGPQGPFAVGQSVEVFGRHPVIRECPVWADVEPYASTANPGADWPTTDTVPALAPGEYEVVMQMSAPFAYDLIVEGVDISQELPPMKAVSLGLVRIAE